MDSTRTLVDCLITQLTQYQEPQSQIQTSQGSGLSASQAKPVMLTLHCLFPHDFLPALDILDRKLVRMVRRDRDDAASSNEAPGQGEDIFLVISAVPPPLPRPASSTRPSTREQKGYEVRLHAWNCSCPTFTLSAYRDSFQLPEWVTTNPPCVEPKSEPELLEYSFGGSLACKTAQGLIPVCKHILASLLYVRCPELFGVHGEGGLAVSMEELAGWCAGWGD